jgi:hypothetical protein
MKKSLQRDGLSCAVFHASREAAQEKVNELLNPIMVEAEKRYYEARGKEAPELWKDIDRVHTSDEEEYVDAVLERCESWLKQDMPGTFEELQAFGLPKKQEGGTFVHIN